MKKRIFLAAFVFAALHFALSTKAQIATTMTHQQHDKSFSAGRDFWIAEMTNAWDVDSAHGAYMHLYVTSEKNTTAYIQYGNTFDSLVLSSYQSRRYTIPPYLQIESSGSVEEKSVHVWSKDADLIVNTMNANDSSSTEGTRIIPTIGWGTDYVVAASSSLFTNLVGNLFDFPSACVIVANQDNTSIDITPSCNCRACPGGNGFGDTCSRLIAFQANQTFTITLNRGESYQLLSVKATGLDGFDLTGTIIHSNKPIGVFGGASASNIPANYSPSNHVEEMVPPIRTWEETYMGTSYHEGANTPPGKDYALYLLISSVPNQNIYRHDCVSGDHVATIIQNKYGTAWDEEELGQKYYSEFPFLCMQYQNSANYPDGSLRNGGPSEGAVTAREQFVQNVTFQCPDTGDLFLNFVDVVVDNADAGKTLFDGHPIRVFPAQCIDNNWSIYTIVNVQPGTHTITGDDSGVGVFTYGYSPAGTYAWNNEHFEGSFTNSYDTVPPSVETFSDCFHERVHLADSGLYRTDTQSRIAMVRLDSIYNMNYVPNPDFVEGSDVDTTGYSLSVIDSSKVAILMITAFDQAGNGTTITSRFGPYPISFLPLERFLGISSPGDTTSLIGYDTLFNLTNQPVTIDSLFLLRAGLGFSLHDSIGGPLDHSPLKARSFRRVQIQFRPVTAATVFDSIVVEIACVRLTAAIYATGGANDFLVEDQSWPAEFTPAPAEGDVKFVTIQNLSPIAITIDSVWIRDSAHFKLSPSTMLPLTIPAAPAEGIVYVSYFPNTYSAYNSTQASWFSKDVRNADSTLSPRFDSLSGWPSVYLDDVGPLAQSKTMVHVLNGNAFELSLPNVWELPARFELLNALGQVVFESEIQNRQSFFTYDALARGIYFWRVRNIHSFQSGKIVLGN